MSKRMREWVFIALAGAVLLVSTPRQAKAFTCEQDCFWQLVHCEGSMCIPVYQGCMCYTCHANEPFCATCCP